MSTTKEGDRRRGRGQPSPYRDEHCRQAAVLARLGATDADLAEAFEVNRRTILKWRAEHVEFDDACKVGKDAADDRVVSSLYERAVGGDVTACIFWLKNRRPEEWRDRREVSGPDGGAITIRGGLPEPPKTDENNA